MSWTKERTEILKKLWIEGLSCGRIADTMGDVSKGAVIGKVHRMGWNIEYPRPTGPASVRTRRPAAPRTKPKPAVKIPEPTPASIGGKLVTVLTIARDMCRWPVGEPRASDFHFCGVGTEEGSVYCAHHMQLAHADRPRNVEASKWKKT